MRITTTTHGYIDLTRDEEKESQKATIDKNRYTSQAICPNWNRGHVIKAPSGPFGVSQTTANIFDSVPKILPSYPPALPPGKVSIIIPTPIRPKPSIPARPSKPAVCIDLTNIESESEDKDSTKIPEPSLSPEQSSVLRQAEDEETSRLLLKIKKNTTEAKKRKKAVKAKELPKRKRKKTAPRHQTKSSSKRETRSRPH